jgi:protein PhnA
MAIETFLKERSDSKCELCGHTENLASYDVIGSPAIEGETSIAVCQVCLDQINDSNSMDVNHWRCLNDSMWSQVPAVQIVAWRMLTRLRAQGWPQDLLDMLYLDNDMLAWAKAGEDDNKSDEIKHVDSNGVVLEAGDTVVIIKDLNVKGTSFTAKRGTSVRGISLVSDNPEHIEGRVNGQQIVILTKFVKSSKKVM